MKWSNWPEEIVALREFIAFGIQVISNPGPPLFAQFMQPIGVVQVIGARVQDRHSQRKNSLRGAGGSSALIAGAVIAAWG